MKLNRHCNFQTILGECGLQECPAGTTCTCSDEGNTCSITGRFGFSSSYSNNVNAPFHSIDDVEILQMNKQNVTMLFTRHVCKLVSTKISAVLQDR